MNHKLTMKRTSKEWFVTAPWGKIALISWGDKKDYPVLMAHGRQDSSATFYPLLALLPDNFYYVSIDLPGNGKSDPYPTGVTLSRFIFMSAMDVVIRSLNWREFYFIGHSQGSEIGLFYNAIYRDRIKKFVLLDPLPAIRKMQIVEGESAPMHHLYEQHYENYKKQNTNDKFYTKDEAVKAISKARNLNAEQAEVLLSRNLHKVGDDLYRLSWDRRLRLPARLNVEDDFYIELFSNNCPPTLLLNSKDQRRFQGGSLEAGVKLLTAVRRNVKNFLIVHVDGDHDVHFKEPKVIAEVVNDFLLKDFGQHKGKF